MTSLINWELKRLICLDIRWGEELALTLLLLIQRNPKVILESTSPGLKTEDERMQRRMKDGELANFIKKREFNHLSTIGKKSLFFQQWKIFHLQSKNRLGNKGYPIMQGISK